MKNNTLERIFNDYNNSKSNKSKRLSKSARNSVKVARALRKDKGAIWVTA